MSQIKPGIYQHFKGNRYHVFGTARHSETEETLVVYKALYGEGSIWVRPLEMWNQTVQHNGKNVPRFLFVKDASYADFN